MASTPTVADIGKIFWRLTMIVPPGFKYSVQRVLSINSNASR